jgi:hypothetical protein
MAEYLSSEKPASRNALGYFHYLRSRVHRRDENNRTLIWISSFSPLDYRDLLSIEEGIDRLWYAGAPLNVIDDFLEEYIRFCESWELYRKCLVNSN